MMRRPKFPRRSRHSKRSKKRLIKRITTLWVLSIFSILLYDYTDEYSSLNEQKYEALKTNPHFPYSNESKVNKGIIWTLSKLWNNKMSPIVNLLIDNCKHAVTKILIIVKNMIISLLNFLSPRKFLFFIIHMLIDFMQYCYKIIQFTSILIAYVFKNIIYTFFLIIKNLCLYFSKSFYILFVKAFIYNSDFNREPFSRNHQQLINNSLQLK